MKFAIAWVLFGAVFQLAFYIRARYRMGSHAADTAYKAVIGRNYWTALSFLLSSVLWPLSFVALLIPKRFWRRVYKNEIQAVADELQGTCHDCGEPLDHE